MQFISRGFVAGALAMLFVAFPANAQDSSINVQCPPTAATDSAIECIHLVAGDGMATMADGYPQYIFGFAEVPLPADATYADGTDVPLEAYPSWVMQQGMLAANAPAPTIAVDEDDELYLSLTNVGMTMRPDLFDPHTVHWHGFPQAASVFDGVPDSSISINMGATLTYYYNVKDAGTYMYHCHVEATEHMQMGMLGNLFVRPRQNRLGYGGDASTVSRLGGNSASAIEGYAYNDGDGTTAYDVEVPIQMGSFDPDFHDASLNVQPLPFAGMRDRYFLLNGRGYPDTVNPAVLSTTDPLLNLQPSQPVNSLVEASPGDRVLLRISNLNITEFYSLGSNLPMQVVALDARLLRDDVGNNMYYTTNSLTLGGGQSADVIIDTNGPDGISGNADDIAPGTYFLYTTNLDRLANDAENFGGMMTEIRIN